MYCSLKLVGHAQVVADIIRAQESAGEDIGSEVWRKDGNQHAPSCNSGEFVGSKPPEEMPCHIGAPKQSLAVSCVGHESATIRRRFVSSVYATHNTSAA